VTRAPVPRATDARVAGGLLLTFGTGWLLRQVGLSLSWEAIVAGVLLALGVAMMVTPRGGHGAKLWFLGLALTLGLASMSSVSASFPAGGISDKYVTVHSIEELQPRYEQLGGQFTLDLHEIELPVQTTRRVATELGAGRLIIEVPDNANLLLISRLTAGDVWVFGKQVTSGVFQQEPTRVDGNDPVAKRLLEIDAKVTAGEIIVIHHGDPLPHNTRRGWNG